MYFLTLHSYFSHFSRHKWAPFQHKSNQRMIFFSLGIVGVCSKCNVAASAQAWVDQCILAHGAPSTRLLNGYHLGENLFYSSSLKSWTDVIGAWHSEVERYNYPIGSTNGKSIGHYTQVIWNSSYKVGCGATLCPDNIYYYGCHYYRAGNFRRWVPYTAGPPCESCPNNCVDKLCNNPCPYIDHYINCPILKNTTGCSNELVKAWCPASCTCTTEIIPIG
uniref:ShKT domain-containing protein n=1 Tax=Oreochromis aureus TaxID=47969 RepID=A0AAZ1XPR1_OREAU